MTLVPRDGACRASIIIPVYRDWPSVILLLGDLRNQARNDCHIVIVDNDPSGQGVPMDLPDPLMSCQIVSCDAIGSYAARNAGAKVASGNLLIFTDSDCRPQPGWLDSYLEVDDEPLGLFAGPVIVEPGKSPNDWAVFDTVRGMRQEVFVRHGYAVTANLAVPRRIFDQMGGFDATRMSGGDAEFCRRAGRAGFRTVLLPDAVVFHPARDSWDSLATKARRIKGGQVGTGPITRRIRWSLRSLMLPLREMFAYMTSSYPLRWRLIACRVRLQLWSVEINEIVRLIFFKKTVERR